MKIPIAKPFIDENEMKLVQEPLKSGWLVQGRYVQEFEKMFCDFTKAKYALATTSCTTALHLSLVALDIKPDDKVLIPSFTYVATANVVENIGAVPIFVDIDLDTFNIDVDLVEKAFNSHEIKAIIVVNLFGLCANLKKIKALCKKYNVKMIEDSACGFDAWIDGKHSGTFGSIGCFSFHPRKSITTGEGGMVVTNNKKLYDTMRQLKDHGASLSDAQREKTGGSLLPEFYHAGFNYRMTDMQGALGVAQMQKADMIMSKKREVAKRYDEFFQNSKIPKGYIHGYQSYVILFTDGEDISKLTVKKIDKINEKRNNLMRVLEEKGISTRQGTHAVHTLKYYKDKYNLKKSDFIKSYAADRLSIALPLYAQMSDDEVEYVISSLKEFILDKKDEN